MDADLPSVTVFSLSYHGDNPYYDYERLFTNNREFAQMTYFHRVKAFSCRIDVEMTSIRPEMPIFGCWRKLHIKRLHNTPKQEEGANMDLADELMTSSSYLLMVRMFVSSFAFMDKMVRQMGLKFYEASFFNVFQGMGSDTKKELQNPDVLKPATIFLACAQQEKTFNGLQRFYIVQTVREMLSKRQEIRKAIKLQPEVAKETIRRPMFIVGFPRTGTTLLLNLLSLDPQFRSPWLWEMWNPTPPGCPTNWWESKRYRDAAIEINTIKCCGCVGIDEVHELNPDNPEECIFMLTRCFLMYHHFLRLKGFRKFGEWFYNLKREDIGRMYELHERHLQLIGFGGMKDRTWVLKAHVHLLNLEALLDVYPDACLVFTYRKLTEIIPSFCSLILKATDMWGPADSLYGKRVLNFLAELSERAVRVMHKYRNMEKHRQPFFFLEYKSLMADPITTIRGLYEHYGFRLKRSVELKMREYLIKHPKHKKGVHKYSMEGFGLSDSDIHENFEEYLEFFKDKSDDLV